MTTTPPDDPTTTAPAAVRTAIADAVTADTGRQDLLVEYAHALGSDPAVADLDDDELEQAVRVGAAEIAAATCRWLQLLAELVVRDVWVEAGARTPAAWLSWALGMAPSTSREHIRVALRLRECPRVRERMAAGRLSYSKARAITRVATPDTEQLLLDWSDAAPAHVLERIIGDTRRQQRAAAAPEERDDLGLTRRWRADGTYEIVLRTDGGTGLALDQDIDRLLELDHDDDGTTEGMHGDGGDRNLVVVNTSAAELLAASDTASEGAGVASAEAPGRRRRMVLVRDGRSRVRAMSARTLWRLACSARLDLVVDDGDGHPADLGRSRRAPDARLRRLLQARDRTCRFPGCGATRYLHAHHVVHWQDGGTTDLDNLVLLCSHHHRVVHRGWELRPAGTGRWTFHAPDGRGRHPSDPHPWSQGLPGASAEAVTAAARAHANDVSPAARARLLQPPHWDGSDHDHSMTVGILAERLQRAA